MESFAGVMLALSVLAATAALLMQAGWLPRSLCVLNSFPFSAREFLFSAAERSLYDILRQIAPDHTIFAKARLSDVISASKGAKMGENKHRRTQSKQVDFLICNAALKPVVAIELDPCRHGHTGPDVRDQFLDAVLVAAKIPVIRLPERRSYAFDEIRRAIFPHLHGFGPAC
jgi:Protein of unknown function (DUF2726)